MLGGHLSHQSAATVDSSRPVRRGARHPQPCVLERELPNWSSTAVLTTAPCSKRGPLILKEFTGLYASGACTLQNSGREFMSTVERRHTRVGVHLAFLMALQR